MAETVLGFASSHGPTTGTPPSSGQICRCSPRCPTGRMRRPCSPPACAGPEVRFNPNEQRLGSPLHGWGWLKRGSTQWSRGPSGSTRSHEPAR